MDSYSKPTIITEPLLFNISNNVKYGTRNQIQFSRKINIDFIRHGESENNAKKLITGNLNSLLTEKGRLQAINVGKKLKTHYDIAFTSTLRRAYETLQIIISNNHIKVNQIRFDCRVNERNLGNLQGTAYRYIPEYANGKFDYSPENGESYTSVLNRCMSFLHDLSFMVEHSDIQNVLVSTHVGPLRIFTSLLNNITRAEDMLAVNYKNGGVFKAKVKTIQLNKMLKQLI